MLLLFYKTIFFIEISKIDFKPVKFTSKIVKKINKILVKLIMFE